MMSCPMCAGFFHKPMISVKLANKRDIPQLFFFKPQGLIFYLHILLTWRVTKFLESCILFLSYSC